MIQISAKSLQGPQHGKVHRGADGAGQERQDDTKEQLALISPIDDGGFLNIFWNVLQTRHI